MIKQVFELSVQPRPIIAVLGRRGVGKTHLLKQIAINDERTVVFPKIWREWDDLERKVSKVGYRILSRANFDVRRYLSRHRGARIIFDDMSAALRSVGTQAIVDLASLSRHFYVQLICAFPSPDLIPRQLFTLFDGFIVFGNNISASKWKEYLNDGRKAKIIANLSRNLKIHEFFMVSRDGKISITYNGSFEDVKSFLEDLRIDYPLKYEQTNKNVGPLAITMTEKIRELASAGLSYSEIARTTRTTVESVSTIVSRLRRRGIQIPYRRRKVADE